MKKSEHQRNDEFEANRSGLGANCRTATTAMSRRGFISGLAGAAAMGGMMLTRTARAGSAKPVSAGKGLPRGAALRVKPVLIYNLEKRQEKTSWRSYGGIQTKEQVNDEAQLIRTELKELASRAEFPIEVLPLALVYSDAKADEAAGADCDVLVVYPAGGWQVNRLAASKTPNIMFLRHKSGHHYLWYEIAHWRFLRKNGDTIEETNMDVDDIVVDDYDELLWRLRAMYGLKNARGTKMLAIGGLGPTASPARSSAPRTRRTSGTTTFKSSRRRNSRNCWPRPGPIRKSPARSSDRRTSCLPSRASPCGPTASSSSIPSWP